MIANIEHQNQIFKVDLSKPIDISIEIQSGKNNLTAWYVGPPKIEAVKTENWIGEVNQGGSVNFFNIFFNPHGHGTHTECVGHISKEKESVNDTLNSYFFKCQLMSLEPKKIGEDRLITLDQIEGKLNSDCQAFILRTLPNNESKKEMQYSNTNPPYIDKEVADYLRKNGIKHFLIDLPSVDKEIDGGVLAAHHAFWDYPNNTRKDCTITELIFVPQHVHDGKYLLHLNFAPFKNDASPSRPVLYSML
jgi:kynurenine formamidase